MARRWHAAGGLSVAADAVAGVSSGERCFNATLSGHRFNHHQESTNWGKAVLQKLRDGSCRYQAVICVKCGSATGAGCMPSDVELAKPV